MDGPFRVIAEVPVVPLAGAAAGVLAAGGFWLAAKSGSRFALHLRFLAAMAGAWVALCIAYAVGRPENTFAGYLAASPWATAIMALLGVACYLRGLLALPPGERQWRRSSALFAGLTLMASAFVRATYQPAMTVSVQAPLALLFAATVWRFRAELLVYLALLSVAMAVILGAHNYLAEQQTAAATAWVTSTAAGLSLAMVLAGAMLGLWPRQAFNLKWYRQGLLIVPLVASSLAAMAAGSEAVWDGVSGHTVWALEAWWAVLLVSAVGLKQADLFGFSSIGAALAAVAAFAVLGGERLPDYWGRYPSVLLLIAVGAALLAALLRATVRRPAFEGFPRALYLAGAVVAIAALGVEPFGTTAPYLGVDLLLAAAVLALAHVHRAPPWVNYLVAALATAGVGALAHLGPETPPIVWHHRLIQVLASGGVAWLGVALAVREVLRHTASDRSARRQTLPFTIVGMATTLALAGYLTVQQTRTYMQFFDQGTSETLALLGPSWGLVGWLAVVLAWLLSMWLVRHTARTFLFYFFGIAATIYLGLFGHTKDLYAYLIYAVAGYGAAHLAVYLWEARFMALLSRTCALYREERRASTTIFTLAAASCLGGAGLAVFRLHTTTALVMLAIMAGVFLAWAFIWLRGEMLYPAVLMVTLVVLAIWHNLLHPRTWDAGRLAVNAMVLGGSAFVWLGIAKTLDPIRGEVYQLAVPARASSVILGLVGVGFAAAMAVSPTFGGDVWRQPRTAWDWALGLSALALLMGYFAWARFALDRRFFGLVSGLVALLLGLYVGIYIGVRL